MAITVPTSGSLVEASWGESVADAINTSLVSQSFIPFAYPLGAPYSLALTGSSALSTVADGLAGAVLVPFMLMGPMAIQSVTIRLGADAANTRVGEFALYRDDGTSTLQCITGTDGTLSLASNAAAADETNNVSTPGTIIQPGIVWLAVRNTSATVTLGVGYTAQAAEAAGNLSAWTSSATVAALGETLDTATMETRTDRCWVARLNGRVFGEPSAF